MKKYGSWRMSGVCAAVLLAFGLTSPAASAATFAEGERAYLQQDYSKSLGLLGRLARRGHAKAQYLLGRQYQFGQGTAKNNVQAYYWFRKAERQGHVEAGLFRHLLVSKRGMTGAEVARAKKLLSAGGPGTLAAANRKLPTTRKPAKKLRRAQTVPARKRKQVVVRNKPAKILPRKNKAWALARRPVKAPPKAPRNLAVRPPSPRMRNPSPYATAPNSAPIVPPPARTRARPPQNGWTHPNTYRPQPCTWCRNNAKPVYRDRTRPQPYNNRHRRTYRKPRYQRFPVRPRYHVPRYVYRLPPWQRRQWLRRHRWRIVNDPFYRRAWRAYLRYRPQYRSQYRPQYRSQYRRPFRRQYRRW